MRLNVADPNNCVQSLPGADEFPLWRIGCRICYYTKSKRKILSSLLGRAWGRGSFFPAPESNQWTSIWISLYLWFSARLNLPGRCFRCWYDLPSWIDFWNHSEGTPFEATDLSCAKGFEFEGFSCKQKGGLYTAPCVLLESTGLCRIPLESTGLNSQILLVWQGPNWHV